jgi:hypothetical protein
MAFQNETAIFCFAATVDRITCRHVRQFVTVLSRDRNNRPFGKSSGKSTLHGNLIFKGVTEICLQVNEPLVLICIIKRNWNDSKLIFVLECLKEVPILMPTA